MKECPICHARYDDSQSFCTKDGHQLRNVEKVSDEAHQQNDISQHHPKEKKGCLKKIIIGTIILIFGLVLLYNHLINAATYLRTEPSEIRVSKAGGSCQVDIDYDGYIWTINHQPEWVEIDEGDNDFELVISPNFKGQVREGSVTIQSGKLLAQIVVKQNAYATIMKASEAAVNFKKSGGYKDITIESDGCSWDAEYTNWMTVTKESDSELHINCPYNDGEFRTGTITVKEDNVRVIINVTQSGVCNNCHGSGDVSCSSCLGLGGIGYGMYYSGCIWCGGKGKVTCGLCNGTGIR